MYMHFLEMRKDKCGREKERDPIKTVKGFVRRIKEIGYP